jgi:hypothetical protein
MLSIKSGVITWLTVVVTAACLCAGAARSTDGTSAQSEGENGELPEVVVTGEQPGPGLWQVRKGDHVLWVLGEVSALPKRMKWKANGIDRILASSQAMLWYPGVQLDSNIGAVSIVLLLPSLIGVEDLPDGATLGQVLPTPVYARWTVQRQKYLGNSGRLERLRPFIAADRLANAAHDKADLTDGGEVDSTVRKLAKKYRVKSVDAAYHIFIKDPKALVKKFKKTSLDESACFNYRLDELEYSLAESTLQANAWATGNVGALKSSLEKEPVNPCWHGLGDISFVKDLGVEDIVPSVNDAWLKAAEKSLLENEVSFAVLGMGDVLRPDGLLATLKSRGYTVLGPGEATDAAR